LTFKFFAFDLELVAVSGGCCWELTCKEVFTPLLVFIDWFK
jgi:hypothetical protein